MGPNMGEIINCPGRNPKFPTVEVLKVKKVFVVVSSLSIDFDISQYEVLKGQVEYKGSFFSKKLRNQT